MADNTADTTVDELLDGKGSEESTEQTQQAATPAEQEDEVQKTQSNPEIDRLQKELSRLRAAQSAADKRAEAERKQREQYEAQAKRAQYGDDETAYWKSIAEDKSRKAELLELQVGVSDLLSEYSSLPSVVKDAVRKNPLGFAPNAQTASEAIVTISSYLSDLSVKHQPATQEEQPTGKEFKVTNPAPRKPVNSGQPKNLSQAVDKLLEAGIFD